MAQMAKNLPAVWEICVWFLGWEDPLEEGMAIHSSILARRIPTVGGAWGATVHGVPESDTTKWLRTLMHISIYSCHYGNEYVYINTKVVQKN